jgi:hypothetical protein
VVINAVVSLKRTVAFFRQCVAASHSSLGGWRLQNTFASSQDAGDSPAFTLAINRSYGVDQLGER